MVSVIPSLPVPNTRLTLPQTGCDLSVCNEAGGTDNKASPEAEDDHTAIWV